MDGKKTDRQTESYQDRAVRASTLAHTDAR